MNAQTKIYLGLILITIAALAAEHFYTRPDPHAPIYYECARGVCQVVQNGQRLKDEIDPHPADADTITTYREVWDGQKYVKEEGK
jgi:hypothetical protein